MRLLRELGSTVATAAAFTIFVLVFALIVLEWASGCGEPGGSCIWLGG